MPQAEAFAYQAIKRRAAASRWHRIVLSFLLSRHLEGRVPVVEGLVKEAIQRLSC